jgi:hypothetical protein
MEMIHRFIRHHSTPTLSQCSQKMARMSSERLEN